MQTPRFVCSLIFKVMQQYMQEGVRGWIRNWVWSEEERLLLMNIGGSRFCNNVGRHHKSNGIYYLADLQVQQI